MIRPRSEPSQAVGNPGVVPLRRNHPRTLEMTSVMSIERKVSRERPPGQLRAQRTYGFNVSGRNPLQRRAPERRIGRNNPASEKFNNDRFANSTIGQPGNTTAIDRFGNSTLGGTAPGHILGIDVPLNTAVAHSSTVATVNLCQTCPGGRIFNQPQKARQHTPIKQTPNNRSRIGSQQQSTSVSFAADGHIVSAGGKIFNRQPDVDAKSGSVLIVKNGKHRKGDIAATAFTNVCFNGDGHIIALADRKGHVHLFFIRQNRFCLLTREQEVSCLGFTKRNLEEVCVAVKNVVRVYSVDSRKPTAVLKGHARHVTTLDASNVGGFFMSVSADICLLWDLATWTKVRSLHASASPLQMAKFAPNSPLAVTLFADSRVVFWNVGRENLELSQELCIDPAFTVNTMGKSNGSARSNSHSAKTKTQLTKSGTKLKIFDLDSKYLCAAGTSCLIVWHRLSQNLLHCVPKTPRAIVQLQLGKMAIRDQDLSSVLILLSDEGLVQLLRVQTLEIMLSLSAPGSPFSRFHVDCYSKYIAFVKPCGEMELKELQVCVENERKHKEQRTRFLGDNTDLTQVYGDKSPVALHYGTSPLLSSPTLFRSPSLDGIGILGINAADGRVLNTTMTLSEVPPGQVANDLGPHNNSAFANLGNPNKSGDTLNPWWRGEDSGNYDSICKIKMEKNKLDTLMKEVTSADNSFVRSMTGRAENDNSHLNVSQNGTGMVGIRNFDPEIVNSHLNVSQVVHPRPAEEVQDVAADDQNPGVVSENQSTIMGNTICKDDSKLDGMSTLINNLGGYQYNQLATNNDQNEDANISLDPQDQTGNASLEREMILHSVAVQKARETREAINVCKFMFSPLDLDYTDDRGCEILVDDWEPRDFLLPSPSLPDRLPKTYMLQKNVAGNNAAGLNSNGGTDPATGLTIPKAKQANVKKSYKEFSQSFDPASRVQDGNKCRLENPDWDFTGPSENVTQVQPVQSGNNEQLQNGNSLSNSMQDASPARPNTTAKSTGASMNAGNGASSHMAENGSSAVGNGSRRVQAGNGATTITDGSPKAGGNHLSPKAPGGNHDARTDAAGTPPVKADGALILSGMEREDERQKFDQSVEEKARLLPYSLQRVHPIESRYNLQDSPNDASAPNESNGNARGNRARLSMTNESHLGTKLSNNYGLSLMEMGKNIKQARGQNRMNDNSRQLHNLNPNDFPDVDSAIRNVDDGHPSREMDALEGLTGGMNISHKNKRGLPGMSNADLRYSTEHAIVNSSRDYRYVIPILQKIISPPSSGSRNINNFGSNTNTGTIAAGRTRNSPQTRNSPSIDPNKPHVNFQSLKQLLLKQGKYPDRERPLCWMFLLQIPFNVNAYRELIQDLTGDGPVDYAKIHSSRSYERLVGRFPGHTRKLYQRLFTLLTAIERWCPCLFGSYGSLGKKLNTSGGEGYDEREGYLYSTTFDLDFLPRLLFPFVKIFGSNGIVAFEVSLSVLLSFCKNWFWQWPRCPEIISVVLDQYLDKEDSELYNLLQSVIEGARTKHYRTVKRNVLPDSGDETGNLKSVTEIFLWPLISTLFTTILTKADWLYIFDHFLIHHNLPDLVDVFAIELLKHLKKPLIKLIRHMEAGNEDRTNKVDIFEGVQQFLNTEHNALNNKEKLPIKDLIANTYRGHRKLSLFYNKMIELNRRTTTTVMPILPLGVDLQHQYLPLPISETYPPFNSFPNSILLKARSDAFQLRESPRLKKSQDDHYDLSNPRNVYSPHSPGGYSRRGEEFTQRDVMVHPLVEMATGRGVGIPKLKPRTRGPDSLSSKELEIYELEEEMVLASEGTMNVGDHFPTAVNTLVDRTEYGDAIKTKYGDAKRTQNRMLKDPQSDMQRLILDEYSMMKKIEAKNEYLGADGIGDLIRIREAELKALRESILTRVQPVRPL